MRLLDGRPKQSQKSGDKSSADTHGECANLIHNQNGEVSERFKEHAWKACVGETQPWVRIPPSPPSSFYDETLPLLRSKARPYKMGFYRRAAFRLGKREGCLAFQLQLRF